MHTRRHTIAIAATAVTLLVTATACDDGGPDDIAIDDIATDDITADEIDEGPEDVDDEDSEPDDIASSDDLSDSDVLELISEMSDEEFDEFVDELSDDDYDRLVEILDAQASDGVIEDGADAADDAGEASSGDDTSESADDDGSDRTPSSRDDVDCSAEGLGDDDTVSFTTAHTVVDGQLGDVCFGELDERLVAAWEALAVITPQGQLGDLGLFGGFEQPGDDDSVTLAFVNALDDDGTLFQMSINLDEAEADPAEAQLTMAHEFSHVFASLPSQLERTVEAIDACETYFNGEGCYRDDSIMWQWIQEFWGDGLIDQVDPLGEATAEDGQARCDADAGFFGAYAASTPEEDFAEAFSAYVFDIETFSDGQDDRLGWIDAQPGLAEFRERAVAAGVATPPNNFDECGVG